jgi:pimeloyl-ACP methyl ester carboxylesterase
MYYEIHGTGQPLFVIHGAYMTIDSMVQAMAETLTPELFAGSPVLTDYERMAPDPNAFPALVSKLKALDSEPFAWPAEEIRSISAPTLLVIGDSDAVRPEHAVSMFRLLGGGVMGDLTELPKSQLAPVT